MNQNKFGLYEGKQNHEPIYYIYQNVCFCSNSDKKIYILCKLSFFHKIYYFSFICPLLFLLQRLYVSFGLQVLFNNLINGDILMKKNIFILFILTCLILIIDDEVDRSIKYGFWPNWPYLGSYQPDWNTLTHISYSKWTLNNNGTLTDPSNMSNYYAVRDQAHQHGVKVTLCIHTSDPYVIDDVIANHQTDFINNISNSLQMYGADEVTLIWKLQLI